VPLLLSSGRESDRWGARAVAGVVATTFLVGCGGSGEDRAPAAQVGVLVSSWFTTQDVVGHCRRDVTSRFSREVYGDEAACRRFHKLEHSEPVAKSIRVGKPELRGRRTAVVVELRGGNTGGARGRVELVREKSRWRIDALGPDLLRGILVESTLRQLQRTAERPGLQRAAARRCVVGRFSRFSDEEMRKLGYARLAGRDTEQAVEPIIGCLNDPQTGPEGMSYLRWHLIDEIVQASDANAERCIRSALTNRLSDAEVLEHVERDDGPPPATRTIAGLVAACTG
jgi:hypothetical protein